MATYTKENREMALRNGHVIAGDTYHPVQLISRFQCWLQNEYDMTPSQSMEFHPNTRYHEMSHEDFTHLCSQVQWDSVPRFDTDQA